MDQNLFALYDPEHKICRAFPSACALLKPYFEEQGPVKTISNFALAHMLHQHFPELSEHEVQLILTHAESVHREQRMQDVLKKL